MKKLFVWFINWSVNFGHIYSKYQSKYFVFFNFVGIYLTSNFLLLYLLLSLFFYFCGEGNKEHNKPADRGFIVLLVGTFKKPMMPKRLLICAFRKIRQCTYLWATKTLEAYSQFKIKIRPPIFFFKRFNRFHI